MVLGTRFPGSVHVRSIGLADAQDDQIWAYAIENGLTILSKDKDFVEMSRRLGAPPKVVSLLTGNASTGFIEHVLLEAAPEISKFLLEPKLNLFCIET